MEHVLPLLIAAPLVLAIFLAAAGKHLPRPVVDGTTTLALLGYTGVAAVLVAAARSARVVAQLGGWQPKDGATVGISLVADRPTAALLLLIGLLSLAAFVFTWTYFEEVDAVFGALMLGFVTGMTGFVLSDDVFTMFVFFELMSVCAFALTAHRTEEASAVQGGLGFGLINSLGAYGGLLGVALLYARGGALNLAQLGEELAGHPPDALIALGGGLLTTAWLVKGALVPFHFWLADAHATAPAPVCALFSGVMVPLGLYGAVRIQATVLSGTLRGQTLSHVLLYGGAVTAVVGAVMAVQQLHLKRMLALSTVSHVGVFAIGASSLGPDGIGGAGLYVFGHGFVKAALFLIAGVLLDRYRSMSEQTLYGAATRLRVLGIAWLLGGLALAGLPPFGTWIGKSVVEEAAGGAGAQWVLPLAVVTSALTGAAVLRAGVRIFFGRGAEPPSGDRNEQESEDEDTDSEREMPDRVPLTMQVPVLALLALSLAVGLVAPLRGYAAVAGHDLLDRGGYVASVLAGAQAPVDAPVPVPHVTALGLASGGGGVVLALLLAGFMLSGGSQHSCAARVVRAPARALRAMHTGHVGDQAAWFLVGLAGIVVTYLSAT